MEEHSVHQCSIRVAGGGVYHHTAFLINDDDMLILVEYGEGDILRLGFGGFRLRDVDLDAHIALYRCLSLGSLAIDGDFTFFDECLNTGAGKFRQLGCQVLVETGAELVFYNDEHGYMPVGLSMNTVGRPNCAASSSPRAFTPNVSVA